jgi:hypothetical protein
MIASPVLIRIIRLIRGFVLAAVCGNVFCASGCKKSLLSVLR